jgi:hypothetical protein
MRFVHCAMSCKRTPVSATERGLVRVDETPWLASVRFRTVATSSTSVF